MMPLLQVNNTSFAVAGRTILNNISFSLAQGGRISVLGPNGVGKSTILKSLLRLGEYKLFNGTVTLLGRPIQSYSQKELARTIAYVPQAGGVIPPCTVEELLRLSRYAYSNKSHSGDEEPVGAALALTGMQHLAGRPLRSLSGGERQKAYIAAAIAETAPIILLDEPTSFLDPKRAAEVQEILHHLHHSEGLAIISVTHNINEALGAGGDALVLHRGGDAYFGPAHALEDGLILEQSFQHSFTPITHPQTGKAWLLPNEAKLTAMGAYDAAN